MWIQLILDLSQFFRSFAIFCLSYPSQQWNFYLKHSYGKIYIILLNIALFITPFYFRIVQRIQKKYLRNLLLSYPITQTTIWFEKLNILVLFSHQISNPPNINIAKKLILFIFLFNILECDETSEFQCNDGTCIPDYQKCNNEVNCNYGEDEENCRKFIKLILI